MDRYAYLSRAFSAALDEADDMVATSPVSAVSPLLRALHGDEARVRASSRACCSAYLHDLVSLKKMKKEVDVLEAGVRILSARSRPPAQDGSGAYVVTDDNDNNSSTPRRYSDEEVDACVSELLVRVSGTMDSVDATQQPVLDEASSIAFRVDVEPCELTPRQLHEQLRATRAPLATLLDIAMSDAPRDDDNDDAHIV